MECEMEFKLANVALLFCLKRISDIPFFGITDNFLARSVEYELLSSFYLHYSFSPFPLMFFSLFSAFRPQIASERSSVIIKDCTQIMSDFYSVICRASTDSHSMTALNLKSLSETQAQFSSLTKLKQRGTPEIHLIQNISVLRRNSHRTTKKGPTLFSATYFCIFSLRHQIPELQSLSVRPKFIS